MDRFLDLKGQGGKKQEYLQKLQAEKAQLKQKKEQGSTANIL